jgi:hypothetical protein
MRLIGGRLLEVQHEAGALTRAGHTDRPHIALVDFHAAHPQAVADLRQVHRHARRRLDDEARGLRRQGLAEFNPDHLAIGLLAGGDGTDHVLTLRPSRGHHARGEQHGSGHPTTHLAKLQPVVHFPDS